MDGPAALVHLRIEGLTSTIFDGPLMTRGHNVTTHMGGTHHCDGTNHGYNKSPGPTCISALDDAAHQFHFTWDGIWLPTDDDFLVTNIDGVAQKSTKSWGLLLNYHFTPVYGSQQQVKGGDEVLWAYDAFNKSYFLKLSGPPTVRVGRPVTLTVTDGTTGVPMAGATVGGHKTNAKGQVTLTFAEPGLQRLKAERKDAIRSNTFTLSVI